ncbi:hypothetical protein CCZ01_09225 [Helicobacter monodelphidis]|uniref:hypothetical protein n=1 Tax=Helicobacter sp. 15-1451 TaxID=2004995 RepID=UPI000DCC405E|nr:hypothetical protein [Helicobacter sp. 15-1451]RAX56545.1 hypothetical protein CCZ01_09225 [Helicobacter sp. 15-1451]
MKIFFMIILSCSFVYCSCIPGCSDLTYPEQRANITINEYNRGDYAIAEVIDQIVESLKQAKKSQQEIDMTQKKYLEAEKILNVSLKQQIFLQNKQNHLESINMMIEGNKDE